MSHKTRSGKLFKPSWCADVVQDSAWADSSDVLNKVLPAYLSQQDLLAGRSVCSAWRKAFGGNVQNVQLNQPTSLGAARALSRKALKAFSNTSTLHVRLQACIRNKSTSSSKQGSSDTAQRCVRDEEEEAVQAAAALLRPFGKVTSLQKLELDVQTEGPYTGLPALLPLLPQLHTLDLTGCYHPSSDLIVIAEFLPQLRQLHLNCPSYTNLAGKHVRKGHPACLRYGGFTPYRAEHIAALARLPQLRLLEFPVPPCLTKQQRRASVAVLALLTSLSSLHIMSACSLSYFPLPVEVVGCLSALTGLTHLRTSAGMIANYGWDRSEELELAQAQQLSTALAGMQRLQTLELNCVIVHDSVLQAIGSSLQHLQRLVLDMHDLAHHASVTYAGATAVQHVAAIELRWCKGLECCNTKPLLHLPNMKRLTCTGWLPGELLGPWSAEACICGECAWAVCRCGVSAGVY